MRKERVDLDGAPMDTVHLDWNNLEIAIHPNQSGRIILNYPGYAGVIDGYENKYKKLGRYTQETDLAAFMRIGNDPAILLSALGRAIAYGFNNAADICGSDAPEFYLMGFSAGAGAIAALSADFHFIKKILLMAPGSNSGWNNIKNGLTRFGGEVYVMIGDNDQVVGTEAGTLFYNLATSASKRDLVIFPNCDHQFTGEINGRLISQAPFYAFGDAPAPTPAGGIKLY